MTIAERIYSASTSEEAQSCRLAEKLARRIEDDIVSNNIGVGGVVGSLRELSERYSAGRAAAREAVALLERRGLGRLRPGPCGGFVVTMPEIPAIGEELTNHFRISEVTLAQLKDAREALDPMLAALAAEARPHWWRAQALAGKSSGLEWHMRLRAELARMTGESVIELFVHCLNDLTADFAADDDGRGPRGTFNCTAMLRAIAQGDVETAMAESDAMHAALDECLERENRAVAPPAIETSRVAADRTLSTLVARKLADEVLKHGVAGQRLGSEWDLCERYSVSRATLRQAIRQLQDKGLIEGRRGRGNGLVVREQPGSGSIRLVLAYLIGRHMDPLTAGTLLFQLNRFVPALALARASRAQHAKLDALLTKVQTQDPIDRYDLLRLVQCVSEVADSPIIDMFSRCLAAYEARFHPLLLERLPAGMQAEYFALLRDLLDRGAGDNPLRLAQAKRETSRVLLEMSRNRPM
jgi:DNA-binding FadR family transcriptional regulator